MMDKLNNEEILIQTLNLQTDYYHNPTYIFQLICQSRPATLLLESAEIDSRKNLKSILIVDSALRITSLKNKVSIEALTDNGKSLLPLLQQRLADIASTHIEEQFLNITFSPTGKLQDEDSRLTQPSVFSVLRRLRSLLTPPKDQADALFLGGLFAYDIVTTFEDIPDLPSQYRCPDLCFYLAETLLIMDHQKQQASLQCSLFLKNVKEQSRLQQRLIDLQAQLAKIPADTTELEYHSMPDSYHSIIECDQDDQKYAEVIKRAKEYIIQGDVFQVVPSRQFKLPCHNPLTAYSLLKKSNPSPYMFYMQDQDFTLFGASPESALKYDNQNRQIEIYPIAGTQPRGKKADGSIDLDLDSRIELNMRTNHKELAEHFMLVDLARNDLARICVPGSRHVADINKVDRYSHLMHLVSRIVGTLREELDALHAYQACMNMGTLTGAPKVRAMQLIAEFEGKRRGSYSGAIGFINGVGDMDTCIVIRSAYIEDNIAYVRSGAGIVLDSVPQSEADESRNKAQAVLNAIIQSYQYQE